MPWRDLFGYAGVTPFSIGGSVGMSITSVDPLKVSSGKQVATCMFASREPSTWDAYRGPWARFVEFTGNRTPPRASLPALPLTVAMFLMLLTQHANSYAVIKTASAAIFSYHRVALQEDPCSHALVKAVKDTAKRSIGLAVKNRKEPL